MASTVTFKWQQDDVCAASLTFILSTELRGLCVKGTLETQEECGTEECNSWSRLVSVCEGSDELPTPSIAIATLPVASCSGPVPGHSLGSHFGAAGDVRAPAPSTERRSAHRHCPDPSLNAWGQKRWAQAWASGELWERSKTGAGQETMRHISVPQTRFILPLTQDQPDRGI